jgi:nifR3 family TIM-barrel protein
VKLGPLSIDSPFILAPMAGITNSPFRRLMRRRGSSVVVSELVSANGIRYSSQKTIELLKFHEEERPVGLQIFGDDHQNLIDAAKFIEERGASFVDINMGCPVPKVVSKGGGSAMCRDLPLLAKLLNGLVAAVKIPVTIKIRTGWDEHSVNALDVVRVAEDCGVAWVAIHGRTRAQGYSGLADWDLIGNIKSKSKIPIIGNGDLTTAEKAVNAMRTYGVDAVLIGRGALRNPFIFDQANRLWRGESYSIPKSEDYVQFMDEQKDLLLSDLPPRTAMIQCRKFLSWYAAGFPGCHEFRKFVFAESDAETLWAGARDFFRRSADLRDSRFLQESFLMGGHG